MITKRRSYTKKTTERLKKKRRSTKKKPPKKNKSKELPNELPNESNELSNEFGIHKKNENPIGEIINALPISKSTNNFLKQVVGSFTNSAVKTAELTTLKQKTISWVLDSNLGEHLMKNRSWRNYFISWV
jgi:hypothetical protein